MHNITLPVGGCLPSSPYAVACPPQLPQASQPRIALVYVCLCLVHTANCLQHHTAKACRRQLLRIDTLHAKQQHRPTQCLMILARERCQQRKGLRDTRASNNPNMHVKLCGHHAPQAAKLMASTHPYTGGVYGP
jgi:hypothetical protein